MTSVCFAHVLCLVSHAMFCVYFLFFFFNDTATTEIYTLSLHDALPIFVRLTLMLVAKVFERFVRVLDHDDCRIQDRKSTRLNSSHQIISYAVFCLKKKKQQAILIMTTTAAAQGRPRCVVS